LKKNHNKKKKQKEKEKKPCVQEGNKNVGKHFSNSQYFVRKTTMFSLLALAFLIIHMVASQVEKPLTLVKMRFPNFYCQTHRNYFFSGAFPTTGCYNPIFTPLKN
jgi:hypothetical protein